MMLAALGWRTIRESITARERNFMSGGLAIYTGSGVMYKMCGTSCSGYVLLHYVLQFLLSFGIIVAMNANIERLRAHAIEGSVHRQPPSNRLLPPVSIKRVYCVARRFRTSSRTHSGSSFDCR